ncbi:MAG: TRAP transporter small permease subunit [Methylococcales bacterium]|nr:TRAP transporter small permease subunit [Methylococcales bacterium]
MKTNLSLTSRLVDASHYCINAINFINERIGRHISWLTLLMVLVTFAIVVLRYVFDWGLISMQETVTYMHVIVFMLGAAYTLKHNGHVRVDIFYQSYRPKTRAWVDFLGTLLLLLPVTEFIISSSWDYVKDSWEIHEGSMNSGGLEGVYLLKTTIIIMACLLRLQAISMLLENLLVALNLSPPKEMS